ncbi:hypothetical protein V5E97_24460 [Singulisphaera sp. Ch08]|uniref:Uncharacterized protein n=1 Tax=Singulisphaera sp. Ch08 TaxID=3120278 RepID=A0AAU7C8L6_9BACT
MTSSHPLPAPCQWLSHIAYALDRQSAPRLTLLFLGAVLAHGRRPTVASSQPCRLAASLAPCAAG